MILKAFKYILSFNLVLLLCSCTMLHDEEYERSIKSEVERIKREQNLLEHQKQSIQRQQTALQIQKEQLKMEKQLVSQEKENIKQEKNVLLQLKKQLESEKYKQETVHQKFKDQAEEAEKLAQHVRQIFVFADMLAARVHGYKNKTQSIEESGMYPIEEGGALAGMRANTDADGSIVMVTLPTAVNDDVKKVVCSIASKEKNDARVKKMPYYFVDCPSES